jgi:hypothetical protein
VHLHDPKSACTITRRFQRNVAAHDEPLKELFVPPARHYPNHTSEKFQPASIEALRTDGRRPAPSRVFSNDNCLFFGFSGKGEE